MTNHGNRKTLQLLIGKDFIVVSDFRMTLTFFQLLKNSGLLKKI